MKPKLLNWQQLKDILPLRPLNCHKGNFGHVLVVGGAPGYSGAARLAAEAAARIGAGLVSIATHPEHAAVLNSGRPELMCHAISQPAQLDALIAIASHIVLGPGLRLDNWGETLAEKILASQKPLVVDADGLNYLSFNPQKKDNWILTPHPGEAARLLNVNIDDIQNDRATACLRLQQVFGGTVVLKGAATLIAITAEQLFQNPYGNPAMASGGMGDVLSGMIAGLWAQGLSQNGAAQLGVAAHSVAADYLVKEKHYRTLLAHDIIEHLPWGFSNY